MPMNNVQGHCPACGGSSLFLGEGGHVTCSRLDCPAPDTADGLLRGGETALVQALGGGRKAIVIAHTLHFHGHSLADVRRLTDEELLAVPGIGDTSLGRNRRAFPAPAPGRDRVALDTLQLIFRRWENAGHVPSSSEELLDLIKSVRRVAATETTPRPLDCGLCYEENGEEVHPHPECPVERTVLPAIEVTGAASLPLGDRVDRGFVLVGDTQSKISVDGRVPAVSAEKPVVVEPHGPGVPGGAVTLTLHCDRILIDGKEIGDA
ncbi:hypothetical protein ACIQNU_04510 [Streptomyces sp. NPDC091292]|uniref:hypothetical protein n=1 Tax=Streptomyces sp. NPDC091292 TaxID=3365991 RepID=UPI00380484FF